MKKISYKLIIPIVTVVVVSLFIILYIVMQVAMQNRQQLTIAHIDNQLSVWEKDMKRIEKKAISIASYCAVNLITKQAYKSYLKDGDISKASSILEDEYLTINKFVEENTGDNIRIHFHTSDLKSLLRVWTHKRGDDLSGFSLNFIPFGIYTMSFPYLS